MSFLPRGPVVVREAEAEVTGAAPVAVRLLADASATGGALSTQRVTLGPGAEGAVPHYHRGSAELFFVLDGALRVLTGEEVVAAGPGDVLVVPPRTAHAFAAAPDAGADVLVVLAPGVERFGYFRLLAQVADGRATRAELLASQDRFDNYFLHSDVWRADRERCGVSSGRGR
ncbi:MULTISPECIES: cupin domain-containing protein [Streptomycetaceae]|uniref:Cupin type-2 domain-containing protein n=1 Tax=Streptantibioticus cattleyicolor (strain ATCC 35852 / DSM 46488 / JCM 4925 / NBRC 14057 / NRRL 8057) TaxID=1003195 RepID=F8JWF4_STREN|nr:MULTISPECIES: cupin domain-containing protein [Streptomycetaceae]AEW94531.1 hypothetical protein SCATT_21600 [Streptantibioticus cattleyicolor NRRL 8057 = DSM 46488]MYS59171.1 cupin domain-containing protein [Streptomyces sp. SID5468]CCB74888.1 conserved protein of unknown function [Streptantibioticus cattleyicolor NRRL 8057 = DSM 46488]